MLDAGVARGGEPPNEHGGEEGAGEVGGVMAHYPGQAQDLRRAVPIVLPVLVGLVPLGVVAIQPAVVLPCQVFPGLGFREEVVRQPALEVDVPIFRHLFPRPRSGYASRTAWLGLSPMRS
jgi:hypothetical protein